MIYKSKNIETIDVKNQILIAILSIQNAPGGTVLRLRKLAIFRYKLVRIIRRDAVAA